VLVDSQVETNNNLPNIVEVSMRHSFLTDRLTQFIQQNMQLIFRRQIVQPPIAKWFPLTQQFHIWMLTWTAKIPRKS